MRKFSLVLAALIVGSSVGWSSPPEVIQQQQELVQAQQGDDQVRHAVVELIRKYQGLQNRLGSLSGLRIASDRLNQLDQTRDARAARYLELMKLSSPLRKPLTDAERAELDSFLGSFGSSPQAQLARAMQAEHEKLVEADAAAQMFEKLQLKTTGDSLSQEQVKGLEEIDTKHPTTHAAAVARDFLRAHYNRLSQSDAQAAGLRSSDKTEQLASRRLAEARERLGTRRDKTLFRQALADVIEDYPDTQAAKEARSQLVDLQKTVDAEIANARFINEYWDAIYPSRLMKPGVQKAQ